MGARLFALGSLVRHAGGVGARGLEESLHVLERSPRRAERAIKDEMKAKL